MASPYDWDGGTASFPIAEHDCGDPDLAAAANALYFSSDNSRPVTSFDSSHPWPYLVTDGEYDPDGGSAVALPLHGSDSPDARALANYLAGFGSAPDTDPGVGTRVYVNPANTSSPDAVYALNFLADLL